MTAICFFAPFECNIAITEYAKHLHVFEAFGETERKRIEKISSKEAKVLSLGGLIALKCLTDKYLTNATSLQIKREPQEKPRFEKDSLGDFNISHSASIAVAALASDKNISVGIDIEHISDSCDTKKIANRFFTPQEKAFLEEKSFSTEAFYLIWTAKEAYAKLSGKGLSKILSEHTSPLDSNEPNAYPTRFALSYGGENYIMTIYTTSRDKINIINENGDIKVYEI